MVVTSGDLQFGSAFLREFKGEVITAQSDGYDQARRLWNGDIDRKPLAIVGRGRRVHLPQQR